MTSSSYTLGCVPLSCIQSTEDSFSAVQDVWKQRPQLLPICRVRGVVGFLLYNISLSFFYYIIEDNPSYILPPTIILFLYIQYYIFYNFCICHILIHVVVVNQQSIYQSLLYYTGPCLAKSTHDVTVGMFCTAGAVGSARYYPCE